MESVIEPSDDEEELINSLVKFYETEERTDQVKLININILQERKCYLLIKVE